MVIVASVVVVFCAIVHMNKIEVVDRLRVVFGTTHIPISDSYKGSVMAYIDCHTLLQYLL